jgi:hypothetical protein
MGCGRAAQCKHESNIPVKKEVDIGLDVHKDSWVATLPLDSASRNRIPCEPIYSGRMKTKLLFLLGLSLSSVAEVRAQAASGSLPNADPDRVRAIVEAGAQKAGSKAVLFGMWVHHREILTMALGDSMTTVPATTEMHYRIGGIAETFMSTLPMGMKHTQFPVNQEIQSPVLHAFTKDRKFYEDCTYWNPFWGSTPGLPTSNIYDLGKWGPILGTGRLISPEHFQEQIAPTSVGKGKNKPDLYFAYGFVVANG